MVLLILPRMQTAVWNVCYYLLPVHSSVPYGLLTRKQKGAERPNFVWTFPSAGVTVVTSVPIFGLEDQG